MNLTYFVRNNNSNKRAQLNVCGSISRLHFLICQSVLLFGFPFDCITAVCYPGGVRKLYRKMEFHFCYFPFALGFVVFATCSYLETVIRIMTRYLLVLLILNSCCFVCPRLADTASHRQGLQEQILAMSFRAALYVVHLPLFVYGWLKM